MLRLAYFDIDFKGNPELPFKSKICTQTIFKGAMVALLKAKVSILKYDTPCY
ncbi:hypothetical protein BSCG_00416 [Bacteroides sp. 2_2_4]|nr:hypothetical protein BSCG_00416 [Bacteroides sp. 2_2_4]DAI58926.1 MAG TPA: hypothetical protein [Herelleviridae sp.]DAR48333.1 MAG TPA: hypothetical protein [Caudoviricetes sp.]